MCLCLNKRWVAFDRSFTACSFTCIWEADLIEITLYQERTIDAIHNILYGYFNWENQIYMLIKQIFCKCFLYARAVNHTGALVGLKPEYVFIMTSHRSNMHSHLVSPSYGQTTRDVSFLNIYSECKNQDGGEAAVGGPLYLIPYPHFGKPAWHFPFLFSPPFFLPPFPDLSRS